MINFAIVTLLGFASYLNLGPIPKLALPSLPRPNAVKLRSSQLTRIPFEQQLDALYLFKSQILSGQTNVIALQRALEALPSDCLLITRNSLTSGSEFSRRMREECQQYDLATFEEVALILEVSDCTGAPIATSLDRIIHKLVSQRSDKQLIATELASVKATISILAVLPVIGIMLAAMLGTNVIRWYLHSRFGIVCLVLGLGLEGLGLLWVRSIITKALLETK